MPPRCSHHVPTTVASHDGSGIERALLRAALDRKKRSAQLEEAESKARREARLCEARKLARIEAELSDSSKRIDALQDRMAALDDPDPCPICLQVIDPVQCQDEQQEQGDKVSSAALKVLQCGHRFHASCLGPWLERKRSCPMCRAPCECEVSGSSSSDVATPARSAQTVFMPGMRRPRQRRPHRCGAPINCVLRFGDAHYCANCKRFLKEWEDLPPGTDL